MNHYEAKFAREAKPSPSDWLIRPDGRGRYVLIWIGIGIPLRPSQGSGLAASPARSKGEE